MDLALFFYAAGVMESVSEVLLMVSLVSAFTYCMCAGIGYLNADCSWNNSEAKKEKVKTTAYKYKWVLIIAVSILILRSFIPSKDTMYTMAAAYGVQTAAENPNVQRLAGKSLQVLEGKLDEYLKEGKKAE